MILHFIISILTRNNLDKQISMNYLIILSLASLAASAKLNKPIYLPPSAASAGGADAGLQTPLSGLSGRSQNFGKQSQDYARLSQDYPFSQNQAEILRYENEINDEGYHYAYETSDGTKAEQNGRVIPGAAPEEGSLQVSGSYSYIGDDGQTYTVNYTADENGYHAEGSHLPTPPPIPEAILKSLQLTAGSGVNYDSKRSSYDADAGY